MKSDVACDVAVGGGATAEFQHLNTFQKTEELMKMYVPQCLGLLMIWFAIVTS